jgi:hypothetical protein
MARVYQIFRPSVYPATTFDSEMSHIKATLPSRPD